MGRSRRAWTAFASVHVVKGRCRSIPSSLRVLYGACLHGLPTAPGCQLLRREAQPPTVGPFCLVSRVLSAPTKPPFTSGVLSIQRPTYGAPLSVSIGLPCMRSLRRSPPDANPPKVVSAPARSPCYSLCILGSHCLNPHYSTSRIPCLPVGAGTRLSSSSSSLLSSSRHRSTSMGRSLLRLTPLPQ